MKGILMSFSTLLMILTTVQADGLFGQSRQHIDRPSKFREMFGRGFRAFKDFRQIRPNELKQLEEKPFIGEQSPNEEINFLIDVHTTEIKIRAEESLKTAFRGNFTTFEVNGTEVNPLGFLTYVDNETTEVFLIRVIIASRYIFHVQISVDRSDKGGIFGHGVLQTHQRNNKAYLTHPKISTLMKLLGPKTESEHINIPEFN